MADHTRLMSRQSHIPGRHLAGKPGDQADTFVKIFEFHMLVRIMTAIFTAHEKH